MFQRHNIRRSIASLQTAYQTRTQAWLRPIAVETGHPKSGPSLCQWIEGSPTRRELRLRGGDAFKCGAATIEGKPYCECHCARAYVPLTKKDLTTEA